MMMIVYMYKIMMNTYVLLIVLIMVSMLVISGDVLYERMHLVSRMFMHS